ILEGRVRRFSIGRDSRIRIALRGPWGVIVLLGLLSLVMWGRLETARLLPEYFRILLFIVVFFPSLVSAGLSGSGLVLVNCLFLAGFIVFVSYDSASLL